MRPTDLDAWLPLWDGYNAFYDRQGPTAIDPAISSATWNRFFDPNEPVHAIVAEVNGVVRGFSHYLYHRSTTRIEQTCYLQDLFTEQTFRGKGVGRALIESVCLAAKSAGTKRIYWQTHHTNAQGRVLYDKLAKHHGFIVYSVDV